MLHNLHVLWLEDNIVDITFLCTTIDSTSRVLDASKAKRREELTCGLWATHPVRQTIVHKSYIILNVSIIIDSIPCQAISLHKDWNHLLLVCVLDVIIHKSSEHNIPCSHIIKSLIIQAVDTFNYLSRNLIRRFLFPFQIVAAIIIRNIYLIERYCRKRKFPLFYFIQCSYSFFQV